MQPGRLVVVSAVVVVVVVVASLCTTTSAYDLLSSSRYQQGYHQGRPLHQEKRVHVCTARDVKMMARFVCGLHRRSVRSVESNGVFLRLPEFYNERPFRPVNCAGSECRGELGNNNNINKNDLLLPNGYQSEPRPLKAATNDLYDQEEQEEEGLEEGTSNGVAAGDVDGALAAARRMMGKRDKEYVAGLTIADVRRQCCIHGCLPQDFYGACY